MLFTKMFIVRRLLAIAVLSAALAFAHGNFEHVLGTVTKISPESVTVQTRDQKVVEVQLDAKTAYTRNAKAAAFDAMKVGDRVVIEATKAKDHLVAHTIKLGATTAAKPKR